MTDPLAPLTCWILARPDDPGRSVLAPPPEGVRFVFGWDPGDFASAPPPDALLDCWSGPVRLSAVIARAPGLRWVHARSAGLDGVLTPAVVAHPAALTSGRGVFAPALAEFVVAALLHFAKDVPRLQRARQAGLWEPYDMRSLGAFTVGIVGYGSIGREAAARLRPFGTRVLALRQRPELCAADPLVDEALPPARVRELAERCDAIVVAAPLTPQTRGLFGREAIAAMKPTAVLVNVGRGPVVDEAALVSALEGRRIAGAALDVFETEPLAPGHPFWRLPNLLLSPHCADHVPGWIEEATRLFLRNLERFRRGEPLANLVDKARGY
jgi:phosphoglycerate dehydrogenase-like enzyme